MAIALPELKQVRQPQGEYRPVFTLTKDFDPSADPEWWMKGLPSNEDVKGTVRVYCDGIYDLFHVGHMKSLHQAWKLFPNAEVHLVVGVCSDAETRKNKGRTVLTEDERAESLSHCKWVYEVIEDAPWFPDLEFVKRHQLDYIVHGDDTPGGLYITADGRDVYQFAKEYGLMRLVGRTPGISTSDLITRILKGYDDYVRRNLKKGMDRKDMGVSFGKEKALKIEDAVNKQVEKIVSNTNIQIQKWTRRFAEANRNFLIRGRNRLAADASESDGGFTTDDCDSPKAPPAPPVEGGARGRKRGRSLFEALLEPRLKRQKLNQTE